MDSPSTFSSLFLLALIGCCQGDLGFIFMQNTIDQTTVEVCSEFNPEFAPYPKILDNNTKGTPVIDIYPNTGCEPPDQPSKYTGKIVIVKRQNCTFADRARHVQKAGGRGVIVVSEDGLLNPGGNGSDFKEINITVSIITNSSYEQLRNAMNKVGISNAFLKFYSPEVSYWDPNAAVMWLLAVFTCALGAWSQARHYAEETESRVSRFSSGSSEGGREARSNDEMKITAIHAVVFFGMCSVSILLMYFFYQYLVYVIIAIFCVASAVSLFEFLETFFKKSSCFTRHRIPANRIPFLSARPPIFSLLLFLSCAGLAVFWVVERHASYAWILQDILGFAFCIQMIRQIRLPSFKVSTILLVLFFAYDIFYVFVTPLLTKNKESIMVNIATGGGGKSTEELPMLFKLPRFGYFPYSKCEEFHFSMLGYGDVILPGLHVGFCAVWDYAISNTVRRHCYFISAVIGYALGLILTFVGMYLMMMGQPALLYLAPCCLLSTVLVALNRSELKRIWIGRVESKSPTLGADGNENEQDSLLKKQHQNA